jgi:hypothetical protein
VLGIGAFDLDKIMIANPDFLNEDEEEPAGK